MPEKTLKELEKELAKLEKKFGKGKFEIDTKYKVIKKRGHIAMSGEEFKEHVADAWGDKLKKVGYKAKG